jgi:hypothetical protein
MARRDPASVRYTVFPPTESIWEWDSTWLVPSTASFHKVFVTVFVITRLTRTPVQSLLSYLGSRPIFYSDRYVSYPFRAPSSASRGPFELGLGFTYFCRSSGRSGLDVGGSCRSRRKNRRSQTAVSQLSRCRVTTERHRNRTVWSLLSGRSVTNWLQFSIRYNTLTQ